MEGTSIVPCDPKMVSDGFPVTGKLGFSPVALSHEFGETVVLEFTRQESVCWKQPIVMLNEL